ncbi:MAG: hypothetical protein WC809_13785 [Sinimarinibacterium sp.]|jgi:hypothetical protein
MATLANLLLGAFSGGGRTARYGDFVVVTMSASAFVAPALDYHRVQTWARSRTSLGNAHRDRTAFTDRFETLLARSGCGIATKGSRQVLSRLVKGMEQSGLSITEWAVPQNVHEGVEVKKREKPAE